MHGAATNSSAVAGLSTSVVTRRQGFGSAKNEEMEEQMKLGTIGKALAALGLTSGLAAGSLMAAGSAGAAEVPAFISGVAISGSLASQR